MRTISRFRVVVGLACLLTLLVTYAAQAKGESTPGRTRLEVLNATGDPETRAGAHPDRFLTRLISETGPDAETPRDLEIQFPPGMGGDPKSVPTCTRAEFDEPNESGCPPESRVGSMVSVRENGSADTSAIYNLEPAPGEVAAFGVVANILRFKLSGHLRASDLGLSTKVESLPQQFIGEPTKETTFEFWGVPADRQEGTSIPRRAFLTLPTRCDRGPLSVTVRSRTWQRPAEWSAESADTGIPLSGCGALPFAPTVDFQMDTPVADSPTGFGVDMKFPESTDPDALAAAQPASSTISFPDGMGISPGAATRLSACSDAQLARGSEAPATCPRSSRVGTVEIGAPQLSAPLTGNVYLGAEKPDERFRLFIVAGGEGAEAKSVGTMRSDPVTGRLTTVLDNMPEVAFSNIQMKFDGGPGALFVAPSSCGQATVSATISPNSGGPAAHPSDSVAVGPRPGRRCGEAAPFAPSLNAAISSRRAGRPTTFSALVTRRDGEQSIDKFDISFPPGLSANLGAATLCPDAAADAGSCPVASRLGSAYVEIGSGPETAEMSGDAFLTGPSKKDPFGVAMIFKAAIGPFDLGTFSVREGMQMDPLTGQVSVRTGSLPQSVQGIPIRFRTIGLEIDRPGFMRAPTSCAPLQVRATITSTERAVVKPGSEIAASGCVGLPFKPTLSLALTDRSQLHRGGHPGMRIEMRAKRGEANIRGMGLVLPAALRFNAGALEEICPRRMAIRGDCPKSSQVGTGFARTPVLSRKPMKGAVYVVQPDGDGEPDLWTTMRGQGIELNLRSTSKTRHGHVENRFLGLPDVPLSEFTLQFADHSVFSLQRDLCVEGRARRLAAPTTFTGHNGALRRLQTPMTTPKVCSR